MVSKDRGYMIYDRKTIIEIEALEKKYGEFEIKIPELIIHEDECIGLVGENGAGKSTLIKMIFNIVKKDAGRIKLFQENTLSPLVKEKIGFVTDECHYSRLLCINDINIILKNVYKNTWNEHRFFMDVRRYDLPINKPIAAFSSGMKAKLNIITVFAHNPKLIILDEATNNLDPVVRKEINKEIKNYTRQSGGTVLFSSHLVNELEQMCNRILFLNKGSIILDFNPEQVKSGCYYLVNQERRKSIPKGALSVKYHEDSAIYIVYSEYPSNQDNSLYQQITSTEDLMYYLTKGMRLK